MPNHRRFPVRTVCSLPFIAALTVASPSAGASQIYQLVASNIAIDQPAPLFTSAAVSGFLSLADAVAPGTGFGLSDILDFSFNFAGITVTLGETLLPGGDITAFGDRSTDGASLSLVDLRFDLPSTLANCSLVCAGQIEIGTFDRSNFVAIDDPDALTTSLLIFDAALVPEPPAAAMLGAALGAMLILRRRRRPNAAVISISD